MAVVDGYADEHLTAFVELLASEPAPDVVVRSAVAGCLKSFAPALASLHRLSPEDGSIHTLAAFGYPPEVMGRFTRFDATLPLPVSETLRDNRTIIVSIAEIFDRFPLLRPTDGSDDAFMGQHAHLEAVFLPVTVQGRSEAVFSFVGTVHGLCSHRDLLKVRGVTSALSLWLARSALATTASQSHFGGSPPATLTERQLGVLTLVADGMSNDQIADALGCSRSTVKADLQRIMFTLATRTRTQAVERAQQLGLLTPSELHPA
jgi:DNA-binding CsgD family transcriptional regulator/AcrR family transcriptional regulator